jgi:hypothetical protein
MPADQPQLDRLLQQRDYGHLAERLHGVSTAQDLALDLNWEQTAIYNGADLFVPFSYMGDLWRAGSSLPAPQGDQLKRSSALYFLYSLAVIEVDAPKCADPSAPAHRLEQLRAQNGAIVQYVLGLPRPDRMLLGSVAVGIELATSSVRQNDYVLCGGGTAEMAARLKANGDKPLPQIPNAPGTFGKSYAVPPAPDYAPAFLPPDQWGPKQAQARAQLPALLTRVLTTPAERAAAAKPTPTP